MAKLIFKRDNANELFRIARDADFLNANINFDINNYDVLDISSSDFNDIKNGQKIVLSHNGSTVSYTDPNHTNATGESAPYGTTDNYIFYQTARDLQNYLNDILDQFESYLRNNSGKPLTSLLNTYVNYLKGLDAASIVPLSISLEQYASDQGQNPVHPLELL